VCFYLAEETNFAPAGASYRSRSGKIAAHMAGLFDEDLAKIRAYLGYDFVLDGERMAKDYIDTINAKKSGKDGEEGKKNMRFRAFFLMPLTDWIAQKTDITMEQNRVALEEILAACNCEKITLSTAWVVKNYAEMMKLVDVVTTPGYDGMPKGQEGLIIKRSNATYRWDRSLDWCKVKKFFDFEAVIVGWRFGRKSNAKVMGRVNVAGYLEDGTYFEVGVGSGWSKLDRADAAANFDTKWRGQVMQGKYQEVSLGKNKLFHSLRFPTAESDRGFRDDKVIELEHSFDEINARLGNKD
jgi:ATP-dependent DNA ligase